MIHTGLRTTVLVFLSATCRESERERERERGGGGKERGRVFMLKSDRVLKEKKKNKRSFASARVWRQKNKHVF